MIICFLAHWSTFTDNPSVPIPTNNQVGWGWHYNHIGHDPTLNTHLTFSWSKRREYLSIWWDLPFVSNHNGQKDWCVEDDIVDWKEELRKQDSIDFAVEVKWPAKLCGKTFYFSFYMIFTKTGTIKTHLWSRYLPVKLLPPASESLSWPICQLKVYVWFMWLAAK